MFCKKCGTEQKTGEKFCRKCGTQYPLEVVVSPNDTENKENHADNANGIEEQRNSDSSSSISDIEEEVIGQPTQTNGEVDNAATTRQIAENETCEKDKLYYFIVIIGILTALEWSFFDGACSEYGRNIFLICVCCYIVKYTSVLSAFQLSDGVKSFLHIYFSFRYMAILIGLLLSLNIFIYWGEGVWGTPQMKVTFDPEKDARTYVKFLETDEQKADEFWNYVGMGYTEKKKEKELEEFLDCVKKEMKESVQREMRDVYGN